MDTVARDFINRQPRVEVEPDAEYTCSRCQHHGKVAEANPRKAQGFYGRVEVNCGRCGAWLVLVPKF